MARSSCGKLSRYVSLWAFLGTCFADASQLLSRNSRRIAWIGLHELGPPNGSWSSRWEKYSKFSPWSGPFRFIPFLIPLSHQDNSGCFGWACRSRMCSGVGVLISLLREPNEPQVEAHGNICGRVAGLCGIWFELRPQLRDWTRQERGQESAHVQTYNYTPGHLHPTFSEKKEVLVLWDRAKGQESAPH